MPSLKDLKNRIESVKSTRKITKAMQMVAAAKLRRAQEAAEAARPYTERFNAVLSQLAASAEGSASAPRLLAGTGSEDTQLIVVMTSERGLAGGFNGNIVKIARYRIEQLLGQGRTVKILTVGKKGREMLRRDHGSRFIDHVDLTEVKRVRYEDAAGIAQNILRRFDAGEFDVATLYYSEFQNVITQKPVEKRLIPASFEASEGGARSTTTSPPRRRSCATSCRAGWRRRSSPRCWRTPRASRARGCPPWTTPRATPAR